MITEAGQPEALKRGNRNLILSLIENEPYVSRASLARISGLSRTTISSITKEFIETRLVVEKGDLASTGGRPGTRLELDTSHWFSLGAELRNHEWVFVLVDLNANVVHSLELTTDTDNAQGAIRRLCEGLLHMRQKCPGKLLPAVGIGVPGLVDSGTGIIKRAEDLGWLDVPVADKIKSAFQMQAYIMNRNRAAGLAEARYGAGIGVREMIYIGIGTGISSAVFVNGALLDGANSSSGELGHVTVLPDGPLCTCGNYGCLRMFASGQAMVQEALRLFKEGKTTALARTEEELAVLSGEELCEAAQMGDALALEAVKIAAKYLGIAIANLINMLNPDSIVLGGPVGQHGEPLVGLIQAEVKRRALSYPLSAARIVSSNLGKNAGAIGAARLVLDRKLSLIFKNESNHPIIS